MLENSNPPEFRLRRAVAADLPVIRRMIHTERLNPLGIKWPDFILAVDAQDRIVGCGQIKIHFDGTSELASIAVVQERRRTGIGSVLVKTLQAKAAGPVYLTCESRLTTYYARFGFEEVPFQDAPPYFRRLGRIANLLYRLRLIPPDGLRLMVYIPPST